MPFASTSVRIARLEETALILAGLFGDEPFSFDGEHFRVRWSPGSADPATAAGAADHDRRRWRGGLSVAARRADIVQLCGNPAADRGSTRRHSPTPPSRRRSARSAMPRGSLRPDRADRAAPRLCGHRSGRPASHRPRGTGRLVIERMGGARVDLDIDDLRRSPIVAVGPLDEVCEKLIATRSRYGISYSRRPWTAKPGPGTGDRTAEHPLTIRGDRYAVMAMRPPSTGITVPEMNDARFDERKHASSATSSGWPGRRRGAALITWPSAGRFKPAGLQVGSGRGRSCSPECPCGRTRPRRAS